MKRVLFTVLALGLLAAPAARAESVKGQVTFKGSAPAAKQHTVTKDPEFCLKDGPVYTEDWVVNKKNGGIQHVFVWLATGENGKFDKAKIPNALAAAPAKDVTMDQPCCTFIPHAVAMREGQTFVMKNSAKVAHNSHLTSIMNPGLVNPVIAPGGEHKFPGIRADVRPVLVSCDIHPWMSAKLFVFDHPFFAVTDKDGQFEIKDVPPGEYRLVVWQEAVGYGPAGRKGIKVTVATGSGAEQKIELSNEPPSAK